MRTTLIFAVMLFTSCATEIKSRNGTSLAKFQTDVKRVHYAYAGGGEVITLDMDEHKPSTTIRATGSASGTISTGLAGIITAWFTGGALY